MAYSKYRPDWIDDDPTKPADAAFFDHIEQGVFDVAADLDTLEANAVVRQTVDAKGDLLVGTAADTIARRSVGANDDVFVVDSAESTGVKWVKIGNAMIASNANIDGSKLAAGTVPRDRLATVTRKAEIVPRPDSVGVFADGATSDWLGEIVVPDDIIAGADIVCKVLIEPQATQPSNTAVLRINTRRYRDGASTLSIETDVNVNQTGFTANTSLIKSRTIAASNFQAGDVLRFHFQRLGADGSDTFTGALAIEGGWIEYTGRA